MHEHESRIPSNTQKKTDKTSSWKPIYINKSMIYYFFSEVKLVSIQTIKTSIKYLFVFGYTKA